MDSVLKNNGWINQVWIVDQPMTASRLPHEGQNVCKTRNYPYTFDIHEVWNLTLFFTDKDTCPWLQRVPRTFPTHTSKPWSARIKPNDWLAEFMNHASPAWIKQDSVEVQRLGKRSVVNCTINASIPLHSFAGYWYISNKEH